MKSFNSISGILQNTLLATSLLALIGCEGDGDGLAGTMTINPAEYTWTTISIEPDSCFDTYDDVVFFITTQRDDGGVQGETQLTAIVTHGGNTTNKLPRAFLYADLNNNFAIDANEPIVNKDGDPGYSFSTDNLGNAHLNVRFLTHCGTYNGSVGVYGGGLSAVSDFSVKVTDEESPQ